jgi:hypothetical protein
MVSDNSAKDEAKKVVLGSLLNNADAASKKVLTSYSFTASYKVNLDKMKANNATLLEACATYLGFKVRENEKKLYRNQQILCDRLILKIESLFDIECSDCKETYRIELTDTPLFRCRLCMQGSHNCAEMVKKADAMKELQEKGLIPPGTSWLCHECLKKNNLALLLPPKSPKETQANSSSGLHPIEEDENEDAEDDDEEERDSPRRGRQKKNSVMDNRKSSKTCRSYLQRKCPHGLTGKRLIGGKPCPDLHPRQCRFYAKFGNDKRRGCKKGKDCKFFHPKLCRDSENTRCCFNADCTFHHLKGTARKAMNREAVHGLPLQQEETRNFTNSLDNTNWPPLRKVVSAQELQKKSSMQSLFTPYPPTVDNSRMPRYRKESTSEKDKAFLEKLMENLKDGIISQMDAKISQLQNQIPAMVQEAQWSQQPHRSRQNSYQSMGPQLIPQTQMPRTHPLQMQMPMNLMPTYQGSCY